MLRVALVQTSFSSLKECQPAGRSHARLLLSFRRNLPPRGELVPRGWQMVGSEGVRFGVTSVEKSLKDALRKEAISFGISRGAGGGRDGGEQRGRMGGREGELLCSGAGANATAIQQP